MTHANSSPAPEVMAPSVEHFAQAIPEYTLQIPASSQIVIEPKAIQNLTHAIAHFDPSESISILIDGPNQFYTAKDLQLTIDYGKFRELFRRLGVLKSSYYFSAITEDRHHEKLSSYMTWMNNNGYRCISKPSKLQGRDKNRPIYKGNMDVEIACYAMIDCANVDHIVLASGDGDFQHLVATLQRMGKKVTIVSSERCSSARCSSDLRDQADGFLELDVLRPLIERASPAFKRQ